MTDAAPSLFDLTGRTILVAGGAGYLGAAICRGLARQGATIMVADVAQEPRDVLAQQLRDAGGRAGAVSLDVADESSVRQAVAQTVDQFGRLDVVVNAAYAAAKHDLEELTADEFDAANRVNLTGAFLLAREAARRMSTGGSIILFSSMYGLVAPDPALYEAPLRVNPVEYGVGKAGLLQLVRYLAVTWAARAVRVNAIVPGPFPNPGGMGAQPEFMERLTRKIPLGRVGRAEELVGAIVFLASDASSFVTGTQLVVDGGWTAW